MSTSEVEHGIMHAYVSYMLFFSRGKKLLYNPHSMIYALDIWYNFETWSNDSPKKNDEQMMQTL